MWLFGILIGSLFPLLIRCAPTDARHGPFQASDAGGFLVTGVSSRTADGLIPTRREVRDLKNNFPDQWNVYMLGLRSFQLSDQSDPLSYYAIAGIHSKPWKVWQGAQGIPGKKMGYCPHQNNLFLGWHRPYLALYEQALYQHVQAIAWQFPSHLSARYISAASDFRVPYWDWALGVKGGSVPDFFLSPTVEVIGISGQPQTIPNPLQRYDFHPLVPGDFDGKWASINSTVRWPTSDSPDAPSQQNKFVQDFESRRRLYLDKVNNAFMFPKNMNEFSKGHIEDAHGWIHYAIGGDNPTGHMWPTEYSAFEPLFMLHHCNVDRLFALWQATHPNQYIEPANVGIQDTVWFEQNTVTDANTPLLPFWNTPTTFWTTNQVKDTKVLGYVYPETQSWKYNTDEEYRAAVNATIAELYSSSSRNRLQESPGAARTSLTHLLVDNTFVDWNIQVQGSHLDLPATFMVQFFLVGDFSSDTVTDVGAWNVLSSTHGHERAKKAKRASTLRFDLQGMVSLTASLLDHIAAGKLESLDAKDVVPYLTDKLTWKVLAGDSTFLPHDRLGGLTIEIMSTTVRIPDDPKQLLQYSDERVMYPEVTRGKSGGVNA